MVATTSDVRLTAADFTYGSRRMPLIATHGVVCSSSPQAANAGLRMLLKGGNAVDAALATAITLTVVEPWVNGIGSDAFALVWDGKKLHGLNGSGRAPMAHTPELLAKLGHTEMPGRGWLPVTVPGAPATWRDLHAKFGKLNFEELFQPAIDYAENGWPLGPETGAAWSNTQRNYAQSNIGPEFRGWFETFAPTGREARAGDVWTLPDHAKTLRLIAKTNADAYYRGELAQKLAAFAAETGGYMTLADLAAHESTWVDPISTNYRGHDVWEIPPPGQGIAALEALNIVEGFDVERNARESVDTYHVQIEAMKLAFADAHRYVADPTKVDVPALGMLDKPYATERRGLIADRAQVFMPGNPPTGGTVYLCAADGDGLMISMIQSNYQGFGSGIVIPGTGISLQNRGRGFSLEPGHPNQIAGGKRPYHTIIPAFLTRDGAAVGPFGVMGGHMQPQGHMQMVINQVDYGMNPQTSLDAPRWRYDGGLNVAIEAHTPRAVVEGLAARGHEVTVMEPTFNHGFGRGQIIRRLDNGAYVAGSEPRSDGCAAGW
jgi:gamma-glutamyltranspeptidase/glutathione hydrolase